MVRATLALPRIRRRQHALLLAVDAGEFPAILPLAQRPRSAHELCDACVLLLGTHFYLAQSAWARLDLHAMRAHHAAGRALAERYQPGQFTAELRRAAARYPHVTDALTLALADSGAAAEARRLMPERPRLYRDYLWLLFTAIGGLAVARLGTAEQAQDFYELPAPVTGHVAGAGTAA